MGQKTMLKMVKHGQREFIILTTLYGVNKVENMRLYHLTIGKEIFVVTLSRKPRMCYAKGQCKAAN
ncbi:MAG: hypothetical protein JXK94_11835, partial [Deltaproteobacteria bacterium]|nr:hypothetical protein [Deltaproteobacteria bacterium]